MTPIDALILLLEDFEALPPVAQLGAVASCICALGGSIFWAWRKGRKNAAELVETNSKLKQELEDSSVRVRKIEREIEEHHRTLALLKAQKPAAILAHAVADRTHARDILSELFGQLAPMVATSCREMARVEVALALNAEDQPHLQRAKWLGQTAVLLAPEGDDGLQDLLAEINAISAVWEEERGASAAASMFWNVAFDYVGAGGADVAIPLFERVLDTGCRRYEEGHYAVATGLLHRAILLAHRNFGPEHPNLAAALFNLGKVYNATDRLAEAEPLYKRASAILEKTLGDEHLDVGATLNDLAMLYQKAGRLAEAEPLLKRSLNIRKVLGPEHPDVAVSLNNLAILYQETGRLAEAEPLYKRASAIGQEILGDEHPEFAVWLYNLAILYQETGRLAEAEPLLKRASAILEKTLPPDHSRRMQFREKYANLVDQLGHHTEAAELRG